MSVGDFVVAVAATGVRRYGNRPTYHITAGNRGSVFTIEPHTGIDITIIIIIIIIVIIATVVIIGATAADRMLFGMQSIHIFCYSQINYITVWSKI